MSEITNDQMLALEQAGLLKGRYYIVLEPREVDDDDEDSTSFNLRAYATKDYHVGAENENFVDPTYVVLQGMLATVHDWFEDVYDLGLERVALEAIGKAVSEENLKPEHREKIQQIAGNVITVDFGETH
jgi:hypothetical protein